MIDSSPTIVIVPGLRDHVVDHWQTLLADELPGSVTVPRIATDRLSCPAWVEQIEHTLGGVTGPVILVAHSGGVMMVVHWARRHRRPIHGALLAAPADLELPLPAGYPTLSDLEHGGWLPVPRSRLPFPSIVAASTNDPLASYERVAGYAADWGSRLVDIGAVGHLNPAAGFGAWPRALELIRELGG
jgi:predicted alpha/beta hydrolase family esterase